MLLPVRYCTHSTNFNMNRERIDDAALSVCLCPRPGRADFISASATLRSCDPSIIQISLAWLHVKSIDIDQRHNIAPPTCPHISHALPSAYGSPNNRQQHGCATAASDPSLRPLEYCKLRNNRGKRRKRQRISAMRLSLRA